MPQNDLIPDGGTKDLGRRTVRGGAVVFGSMVLQKAVGLGILATLARLLTPEDYGLLGMVFALTAFLQVFADLGLSMATVQKAEVTRSQVSTLFWVNVGFGALLAGVAAASAPAIAWFYREPELLRITLWLSLGFAVGALGTQHTALLVRRMRFGRLAACDVAGLLAGGGVGIWMALRGYGVYALVGQTLAHVGGRTATAWIVAGWVPGLPVRRSGVREMLRFGGYLTGFNILNYFARNMDKVLLGRFWGPAATGLYTRAYALMILPIQAISAPMGRVMIPALSKLQDDRERYAAAHLRAMRILALISFPVAGGMAVMSEEVVAIVFGQKWMAAVPIFRVLCVSGMFQAWGNSRGWLYTSSGKTRNMFLCGAIISLLVVAGLLPCIWYGPMGAAVGYAAVTILFAMPGGWWYVTRSVGIKLLPIVRATIGPLAATGVMCACVYLLRTHALAEMPLALRAVALVGAGVVCFVVAAAVLARRAVCEMVAMAKGMVSG